MLSLGPDGESRDFERGARGVLDQSALSPRFTVMGETYIDVVIDAHLALCSRLGVPATLLDLNGRLTAATPQIRRLLAAGNLIRLWAGRLQVVSPEGEKAFRQALADIGRAARAGIAQCVRHSVMFDGEGCGRLGRLSLVQGVPSDQTDEPLLLVTLRALNATANPAEASIDAALLRDFGLSPGEVAVARALVLGQSVRQIAEDRWVSIEVVRRELASLYHKVGERGSARVAEQPLRAFAL